MNSLERANKLLKHLPDNGEYLLIKIKPDPFSCCHLQHWPRTWDLINDQIKPFGPIEEEGDVLIQKDGIEYVLECHESGPEIILGVIAANINLLSSVISLITVIVNGKLKESRNPQTSIKVSSRMIGNGVEKEVTIEINQTNQANIDNKLLKLISDVLKPSKAK